MKLNIGYSLKAIAVGATLITLSSCGSDGDSSKKRLLPSKVSLDGFRHVNEFTADKSLTPSEKKLAMELINTSKAAVPNAGGSRRIANQMSFFDSSFFDIGHSQKAVSGQDHKEIPINETTHCAESGKITVTGSAVLDSADNDTTAQIVAVINANMVADQCAEEGSTINGQMRVTGGIDVDLRKAANDQISFDFAMAMVFGGKIDGVEAGRTDSHSISFNDFGLGTRLDTETFKRFESRVNDHQFLKEILLCKGSITIDEKEIGCGSLIMAALES